MQITAIIQARFSSTRLPGKVLLLLKDKTMLESVVERVQKAKRVKKIIVITSNEKSDDKIVQLCKKKKIDCFRGSLNDVLDRYYQAAKKFKVKHICRITADCPFVDPQVIDLVAKKYLERKFDYVSNTHPPTYPDGLDTEIFSFEALEKAWKEAKLKSEREHVCPYIWKNPKKFKIHNVKNNKNFSGMRWTVDEESDLKFVREIYKQLYKKNKMFYMQDVLDLLKKSPELMEMNKGIIRDEGYFKSLKEDRLPISVNICTLNEEKNIGDCIISIKKNNPSEIIVIDGNSTDRTVQIAKSLGAKVIKSKRGLASQRQAGIEASSQKYIAIVDADDRLNKDCLLISLTELKKNKFHAIKVLNSVHKPETYWEKAMASTLIIEGRLPKETNMVGRPALYLASSIKKVGFDFFFNGVGCEDTDISRAFEKKRFKQGIGTGKSYRKHEKTFRLHMKKWKKYGKGDARFAYKYPERKWSIIKHLLINYPLVKSFGAIINGKIKYVPFFILTGFVRFIYFLLEYTSLKFKHKRKKI